MGTDTAFIRTYYGLARAIEKLAITCCAVVLASVAVAALSSCTAMPPRVDASPRGFTFDYSITNREGSQVVQVFDDGKRTYVQFREALPSDLRIRDEAGSEVSIERTGVYAIVPGRHTQLAVTNSAEVAQVQRAGAPPRTSAAVKVDAADLTQATLEVSALRERVRELQMQLAATRAELVAVASHLVIHFANNSARASVDSATLQAIADALRDRSIITLTGYTDANYPDAKGARLAQHRAEAVRAVLLRQGLPEQSLLVRYHSARHFAADNHTSEGRALNRRVEIVSEPPASAATGWAHG